MTSITIPAKAFAEALDCCNDCIRHDPDRMGSPGLVRFACTADRIEVAVATNWVRMVFRVPCEHGREVAFALTGDNVVKLVRMLKRSKPGRKGATCSIEVTDRSVSVGAGMATLTLQAVVPFDSDDPVPDDSKAVELRGGAELTERLFDALSVCGFDATREITKGAWLYPCDVDGWHVRQIVATNGHRLYVEGMDPPEGTEPLALRGDLQKVLQKALSVDVEQVRFNPAAEQPALLFRAADREVRVRLDKAASPLPPWASFMVTDNPPHHFDVTCNTADLLAVVKRVSAAVKGTCKLRCIVDRQRLVVRCTNSDDLSTARERMSAVVAVEKSATTYANPAYLVGALALVKTAQVRIWQPNDCLDTIYFVELRYADTEPSYRVNLVMPVRPPAPKESKEKSDAE